jgi:ABC-type multidrug transport system ATPase subunit
VSGYVNRGELLAVMGPSAAGKSTLLNALSYQNLNGIKLDSGTRYVNGIPMSPQSMTAVSGYVLQEDLFIGTLTVKEHLTFLVCSHIYSNIKPFQKEMSDARNLFQSNLRLSGDHTKKERSDKVDTTMQQLGLTKCANTLIGVRGRVKGISGGEMRRLSFASEALADPPLMLADEPTTGLDSWMAENVIKLMRFVVAYRLPMTSINNHSGLNVIHEPALLLLLQEDVRARPHHHLRHPPAEF